MNQADFLRFAISVLERLQIPYLVCGSVAAGAFGEPRMTRDIDVVLALRPDQVDALCTAFPAPEFYVSPSAAREAIQFEKQFNVIHPESGNKPDLMICRRDEWSQSQLSRRQRVKLLDDCEAYSASPEDVIISKMLYYLEGGSEKHLRDSTGILQVQKERIDRAYIADWASRYGLTDIWEAILRRLTDIDR